MSSEEVKATSIHADTLKRIVQVIVILILLMFFLGGQEKF